MAVPGDCVNAAPAASEDGWRDLVRGGRAPVLALILLGDWLVAADALVTATIMPAVGESLAALAWFGWAAAGFLTGLVMAGASAGWLAERLGVRLAMILGGTVLTAGCLLSASAAGIVLFLAGRVLQGCAAGWIIGLIYVALGVLFPQRHLPRTFALVTSVWGVATLMGPLIGGLFADAGAWRGVFWLFAVQAVLFTIAAACLIPAEATRTPDAALAPRPLLLLGAGVAALASAGLVETTAPALALAATGALLLMLAFAEDRAGPHAVLPTPAVSPGFPVGAAYLTYFATSAAGVAFALYGPALLQFSAGLGALEAGYVVASEALAWTAAALIVAGTGKIWRARLIRIGTASIVAGTIGLTLVTASGSIIAV
ncbi:MAG TPA: MFS transporter, partial [Allosphingosinicella sp.]|nr:MFS transporter [Allosphingosinicella sp.]